MIDYNKNIVATLNTILPTHYEMSLTSKTAVPCISYMENNNYVSTSGDTIGYSRISYQIKVWGNNIADLQKYALEIDDVLRPRLKDSAKSKSSRSLLETIAILTLCCFRT